jgi:signal transduction histidine kinase
VLGYLEMILDGELGPLTDEQRHALQRTQRQSLELLEMISALLDLNRLEAGRLPVHARPVSIGAVLEELRAQLPDNWRRPGVELHLQVAPDLPVVDTDPGKLKTVLRNLVHNAFKFTARGHVTVAAALSTDGEIVLTVTDTGRGIPADAIDYVFDMFRQVHGAGGGGVGLGLHIVRRFVEALGGVVSVTSRVGVGSRFTVILPRTTPAAHPTAGPFRRVATAA